MQLSPTTSQLVQHWQSKGIHQEQTRGKKKNSLKGYTIFKLKAFCQHAKLQASSVSFYNGTWNI